MRALIRDVWIVLAAGFAAAAPIAAATQPVQPTGSGNTQVPAPPSAGNDNNELIRNLVRFARPQLQEIVDSGGDPCARLMQADAVLNSLRSRVADSEKESVSNEFAAQYNRLLSGIRNDCEFGAGNSQPTEAAITNCPGSVAEAIRQREARIRELYVDLAGLSDRFRRDLDQRLTEEALASAERRAEIVRENVGLSQEAERNLLEMIAQLGRSIAELSAGCGPRDSTVPGPFAFGIVLPLASDSTTFCTFRDGNVVLEPVFITPVSGPVTTPAGAPQPGSPPTGEPPTTPPPSGGTPTGEGGPCEKLRRLREERAELLRVQQLIAKARESGAPIDADVASKSILRAEEIQLEEARLAALCNPPPETPASSPPLIDPEDPVDELPPRAPPAQPPLSGGVPSGESDPCEKLRRVREELDELLKVRILIEQASAASAPLDAEVVRRTYDRTDELRMQEARLVKLCQPPISPDPAPSPTDPEDPINDSPPALPSNIFVKATSTALDQGARAQETSGQVIRLFAPEQTDVALPTPGDSNQQARRSQRGHDADPIQAVTDNNGNATVAANLVDFFGNPDPTLHGGFDFEVTIDVTGQTSINVIVPQDSATLGDALTEFGFGDYMAGVDQIGEYQVGTLVYPRDLEELIRGYVEHAFPGAQVEDNLCRIKEPAAVTEYHACKLGDRMPPPGALVLIPPDPREELPGAALILHEPTDRGQP